MDSEQLYSFTDGQVSKVLDASHDVFELAITTDFESLEKLERRIADDLGHWGPFVFITNVNGSVESHINGLENVMRFTPRIAVSPLEEPKMSLAVPRECQQCSSNIKELYKRSEVLAAVRALFSVTCISGCGLLVLAMACASVMYQALVWMITEEVSKLVDHADMIVTLILWIMWLLLFAIGCWPFRHEMSGRRKEHADDKHDPTGTTIDSSGPVLHSAKDLAPMLKAAAEALYFADIVLTLAKSLGDYSEWHWELGELQGKTRILVAALENIADGLRITHDKENPEVETSVDVEMLLREYWPSSKVDIPRNPE